jgi:hypothetical protein
LSSSRIISNLQGTPATTTALGQICYVVNDCWPSRAAGLSEAAVQRIKQDARERAIVSGRSCLGKKTEARKRSQTKRHAIARRARVALTLPQLAGQSIGQRGL